MCGDGEKQLEPGPEVTKRLFRKWQKARRGSRPAEDMTNPVWEWLFRGRIDPYLANERFKSRIAKLSGKIDFPTEPRWAGCRLGQSYTKLGDGREIWIAGEHEDYYDPDFYIYNDVIVRHPDDRVEILGYPESVFRPTDFHSATAIQNDSAILIIGNVGYPTDRREGCTQVFQLNTENWDVTELQTTGDHPGWLSDHAATLSDDGSAIAVCGGKVLFNEGFVENIDDWSLGLKDFQWTRLTDRNWPRFHVSRKDGQSLHLWQYGLLELDQQFSDLGSSIELASELGTTPNLDVYRTLFQPSVQHEAIEKDVEEEAKDSWRTTEIRVDGVRVRFVDDMDNLRIVVEGELPVSLVDSLANELLEKLSIIENAPCVLHRIG